jgi:hypothetical protein
MNKALKKFDVFLQKAATAQDRADDEMTLSEMLDELKSRGKPVPRRTFDRMITDEVEAGRMEVRKCLVAGRIQNIYRIK